MRAARPILSVAAVALLTLASAGCRSADPADDLVLVPRAVEHEPRPRPRYVLLARSEVVAAATGPIDVWLPLPTSDRFQTVHSLAVEVGPPGRYALEEAAGDRVLHVAAPGPAPVSVRALIERAAAADATALPAELQQLPSDLDPSAWAEAAAARGVQARVAQGLELRSDGQTVPLRWPEVLVDGAWSPVDPATSTVDLPAGRVRLGASAPRATVDGRAAELRTSYALEEQR